MENDGRNNNNSDTGPSLTPTPDAPNVQTKKPNKPRRSSQETQEDKKKSYRRSWRAASPLRRLEIIGLGLSAAVGIGYLGVVIWGNLQTKWNFTAEHRPRVIISRPPELLGTIICYVTEKAIHLHAGAMRVWVKNIRKGDAVGAFMEGPQFKLVPEKKIGDPFYDDLPSITDQTCKQKVSPKMKAFPVNGEQEVAVNIVQGIMAVSLIKTKDISVTFGGPQQEPESPEGEKSSSRVPIGKDAVFQLYAPVCVYYFDENGERYGSCRDYRLAINGRVGNPNNYGFSCTESPVSGTFEEIFFGYCEN